MKVILCFLLLVPAAHCFQKEEKEQINRTLKFQKETETRRVLVDNVYGSITVTGYDGSEVQLEAVRLTKAESDERLQEAREEVVLECTEKNDRIEIVVDAPWRSRWGGVNDRGYRYYGYAVNFDFHLKVPRKTAVYLRTVNDGDIKVTGMEGGFEVKNVNGDVTMTDIAGSGHAGTVNGALDIRFGRNPAEDCKFSTVNGKISVTFKKTLSADLVLETFNGNAYTDFDVTAADKARMKTVEKRGKKMYRLGDEYTVRVGNGGPQLAFNTLNGNINIKKDNE